MTAFGTMPWRPLVPMGDGECGYDGGDTSWNVRTASNSHRHRQASPSARSTSAEMMFGNEALWVGTDFRAHGRYADVLPYVALAIMFIGIVFGDAIQAML